MNEYNRRRPSTAFDLPVFVFIHPPKEYNMHTPTKKILTVLALTALVVATAAGFGGL